MVIKRNFNLFKILSYIWKDLLYAFVVAFSAWALYTLGGATGLAFNFTPIGVFGSALAIFVAFRNNSAYGRWWEAAQLWSKILASSRVLARLVITFADSHSHQDNYDAQRSKAFKHQLVYQVIAWAHALRIHLRREDSWQVLQPLLPEKEYALIAQQNNKPYSIHMRMGNHIYQAMANGTLGGFDSFQLEGQLLALSNYQGACERIKEIPLPRQYNFFTRLFVWIFATLLPFGLLGLFSSTGFTWMILPLSLVISGAFIILEKTGSVNEDPFENKITDVPMTYICNQIERDLKEALGETELPAKVTPEKGYLF